MFTWRYGIIEYRYKGKVDSVGLVEIHDGGTGRIEKGTHKSWKETKIVADNPKEFQKVLRMILKDTKGNPIVWVDVDSKVYYHGGHDYKKWGWIKSKKKESK